ncbi:hypothetical protein [Leptolyngbya ohadii]|uniref:hypothetical protein n=1 Tax=Leptolyngbya ohadii TaxID=1962290 RepID=UPI000B59C0CD|nr:hypothetical protein [Leptolyngbya ohadii]
MKDIREISIKKGIIKSAFDYQELDSNLIEVYEYFEEKFKNLYQSYAGIFCLDNCIFYISEDYYRCNAFAGIVQNHNIIGITNGYPILMKDRFDEKYFSNIVCIGFINEKIISDAYCDLYEDQNFKFDEFMLNCSIQYTFRHEFQHILQFNSSRLLKNSLCSENLDKSGFSLRKHAWEFDADRMACYEVLKYTFSVYRSLKDKGNEKLKCIFYIALASIVITKNLFYFGVTNPISLEYTIDKQDFYTKQYSHPHPLVRICNMIEYFYSNIKNDFPDINIDPQEILNNVLGISKIYFDNLISNQNIMQDYFKDAIKFADEINSYNQELYNFAIKDESINALLRRQQIRF